MWRWRGFETLEEAKKFAKETGHTYICGKNGPRKSGYQDILLGGGGIDTEKYPFAITWRED